MNTVFLHQRETVLQLRARTTHPFLMARPVVRATLDHVARGRIRAMAALCRDLSLSLVCAPSAPLDWVCMDSRALALVGAPIPRLGTTELRVGPTGFCFAVEDLGGHGEIETEWVDFDVLDEGSPPGACQGRPMAAAAS